MKGLLEFFRKMQEHRRIKAGEFETVEEMAEYAKDLDEIIDKAKRLKKEEQEKKQKAVREYSPRDSQKLMRLLRTYDRIEKARWALATALELDTRINPALIKTDSYAQLSQISIELPRIPAGFYDMRLDEAQRRTVKDFQKFKKHEKTILAYLANTKPESI